MIQTEEFPRDSWDQYLTSLSREANAHLMVVRIESPSLGDQILARGLPLVGISVEKKGSEQGAVEVIAERPDGSHLTHLIREPARIYLARYEEKKEVCLDIEDKSGQKTLIFIHEGAIM